MKKISRAMMLMTAVMLFVVANCSAQLIVKTVPVKPPVARMPLPARPSPHHVWVAEEWAPNRGGYTYNTGYWTLPPRHKKAYVPGRWAKRGAGIYWIHGYWK